MSPMGTNEEKTPTREQKHHNQLPKLGVAKKQVRVSYIALLRQQLILTKSISLPGSGVTVSCNTRLLVLLLFHSKPNRQF